MSTTTNAVRGPSSSSIAMSRSRRRSTVCLTESETEYGCMLISFAVKKRPRAHYPPGRPGGYLIPAFCNTFQRSSGGEQRGGRGLWQLGHHFVGEQLQRMFDLRDIERAEVESDAHVVAVHRSSKTELIHAASERVTDTYHVLVLCWITWLARLTADPDLGVAVQSTRSRRRRLTPPSLSLRAQSLLR